jgi:protocatechuate 3,4-dioxygenase beta subunit
MLIRPTRRRMMVTLGAAMLSVPLVSAFDELPETDPTGEGPAYKPGAPEKDDLLEPGLEGTPLLLTGRVLSTKGEPLSGAMLDFWEAKMDGHYDFTGYTLRGKVRAGKDGRYHLRTVVPKPYNNDMGNRTAHIHVKAGAPGHGLITTELHIKGLARNYTDFAVRPSLQLVLRDHKDGKASEFDFVLRHA